MINLVNILILIEKISKFTKNTIDKGKTPFDIYKLCSIIRESFCYSYSIRKDNNLYLYIYSTHILILFEGTSLRYLGSDERSQALLLNRALDKANGLQEIKFGTMLKSTPGIFVKRMLNAESIFENINDLLNNKIIFVCEFLEEKTDINLINLENLDNLSHYCYIFPFLLNTQSIVNFLDKIDEKYKLTYTNLSNIKGIENKVLYINFLIDQKENRDRKINL